MTIGITRSDIARQEAIEQIATYAAYKEASDYYIAVGAAALSDAGCTSAEVMQTVAEHYEGRTPLTTPAQVTKYVAWGHMPDEPHIKALGVTRAYSLRTVDGWEADAKRAADPTDSYTWQAFDADHLGKVPASEKAYGICPVKNEPCARIGKE